jgi:hypothetical protein
LSVNEPIECEDGADLGKGAWLCAVAEDDGLHHLVKSVKNQEGRSRHPIGLFMTEAPIVSLIL